MGDLGVANQAPALKVFEAQLDCVEMTLDTICTMSGDYKL